MALLEGLTGPLVEELIYRGVLYQHCKTGRFGRRWCLSYTRLHVVQY